MKLVYVDPNAELMASLKDVPGFAVEEPEELAGDPSHLGAPDGEGGVGEPAAAPAAASPPSEADELAAAYESIDPNLLAEEAQNRTVDWLIIGVVGLLIVTAVMLMIVLVP